MQFGPAGNSRRFYDEGFKRTEQAFSWLHALGLTAYEYSMGRGVHVSRETAVSIGQEAQRYGIRTSVHAPYFINCASSEATRREKSVNYLMQAVEAAGWLGADRVVFHVGAPGRLDREEALNLARSTIEKAHEALDGAGLDAITLCPETMGRTGQIGTLDEVLSLCAWDARLLPALDFGHLHVIGQGTLNSEADFRAVLTRMVDVLGFTRVKHFHVHFSRIDYGPKGEKRHMNFSDEGYGPDFRHLAPVLIEMGLEPVIICESAGDQADDAAEMQRIAREFKENPSNFRDCGRVPDMV
jgi:deoxyribonuclease-4